MQEEAKSNDFLNQLQEEDKYEMIKEVLAPEDYNFIVTPKEIDDLIENMKDIVARRNKLCGTRLIKVGASIARPLGEATSFIL